MSAATRAKISAANKGRHHTVSAATRAKIAARLRGRRLSAATKSRISAANKGKHPSPATRAKLSAAMKGRHPSAATRAKLSAAMKGRHRPPRPALSAPGIHRWHPPRGRRTGRYAGRTLIAAHRRRSKLGLIHTRRRKHRPGIVIRRHVRAHRVWRRRRRR